MQTWFVTGTDTDIGKTTVTAALLQQMQAEHRVGVGLKPIASGAVPTPAGLRNQDALTLMAASAVALSYEQVNPIVFEPAIAPHLAAAQTGTPLSVQRVVNALEATYAALPQSVDAVLIEGAGGWRVPLNHQQWFSDIPKALNCPLLLVVGIRLGCINHALLTAEAIIQEGLSLSGWIANKLDPNTDAAEEIIHTLEHHLPAPCLGRLPFLTDKAAVSATSTATWTGAQNHGLTEPYFDLSPLVLSTK